MNLLLSNSRSLGLAACVLVLSACGGGGDNPNAGVATFATASNPSNSDLTNLLSQGLVNAEALDLDDNAVRQTDDRQDAFDL